MIVHIWYLLPALVLLWLPRKWLRLGRQIGPKPRRRRSETDVVDPNDLSVKINEQFGKLRNWIDFFRAITGGIAICLFCFEVDASLSKGLRHISADNIFLLEVTILAIAVLIQTIKIEERMTLVPPIFFALGLSFGVIGWKAALLACIAIWALNLVLPSPTLFLVVFAMSEVCFGLIPKVGASRPNVILAASLTLLPVLLSALTRRRLVELSKKVKSKREIVRE